MNAQYRQLELDDEAVAAALKAPLAPRLTPTARPPGSGVYRLEDRLPGVMGSRVPPPYALRAMTATYAPPQPPKASPGAALVVIALAFASAVAAVGVYRNMQQAAAPAVTSATAP